MDRLDGAGERKGEKQDLWKPILLDPKVKIENVTSYSWVACLNRWIAWGVRCSCGSRIHHACAMKPRGLALERLTGGFRILVNDSVIIFISRLEIRRFEEHPNSLLKSQILLKSIHKDLTFQSCGRFVRTKPSTRKTRRRNQMPWGGIFCNLHGWRRPFAIEVWCLLWPCLGVSARICARLVETLSESIWASNVIIYIIWCI